MIIIDEYSMIDLALLDKIMEILQHPLLSHIKLVLCGDLNQLPPVSGDPILYSSWYNHFRIEVLTTNHRTEESLLRNVVNDFYAEDTLFRTTMLIQFINTRITYDTLADVPFIYPLNSQCDYHNQNRLTLLRNQIYEFQFNQNSQDENSYFNTNTTTEMRNSFRFQPSLKVAVDARVMLLVNLDQDQSLVNGSMGIVKEDILTPRPLLCIEFITGNTTKELTLQPDFEVHDSIRLKQFPICLAYALTIHKVQGMTLNNLVVGGIDRFWQPQLLYVALSRVRRESDIQFLPFLCSPDGYYTYDQINSLFYMTSTRNAVN